MIKTPLTDAFLGGQYLPRYWRVPASETEVPAFYLLAYCEREAEFLVMLCGALPSEVR